MDRRILGRADLEDCFDLAEPLTREPGTHNRRGVTFSIAAGKGQEKDLVAGEIRVQQHVKKSALAGHVNRRHAGNGVTHASPGSHAAQRSRPLGDQQITIGQKGQAPGKGQVGRHGLKLVIGRAGAQAGHRHGRQQDCSHAVSVAQVHNPGAC